ncbi:MAG: hypothetical protein GYB68_19570, partial [Chloroflexi bacterium]|nr:hypothetical protein [Chloroflexota bacterium]
MAERFPPEGYVATDSAIEGIIIYKPVTKQEEAQATVDFSCPQCGATTAYSIADGGLKCTNCGYYEPPQKEIVGKGAQEFEFTVATLEQAAHGWGEARSEIECQNCLAVTVLDHGQLTTKCPFCGSAKLLHREAGQGQLRPRFIIPFKVEREKLRQIASEWLGSSWLLPARLQQMARLGDFEGIYLPFWTFDAHAEASWRGEVGYVKTRRYYSDGEWKTRTYTDWRWESGSVRRSFDDLVISGTNHISDGVLRQINTYNLQDLAPYEPTYLAGWKAQAYDIELEPAWTAARNTMREQTKQACRQDALAGDADKLRNFT